MKKVFCSIMVIMVLIACSKDKDVSSPDLINAWLLIENYNDPGDGSGGFNPVQNGRTIEFLADGTVTTTVSFCDQSQTTYGMTAVYDTTNKQIIVNDCNEIEYTIEYTIEGQNLLLAFQCIEGCWEKYRLTTIF
ncbi:MAG: hypothetical protein K8F54_05645 [Altibacter sp.]|uniref:hypothetical protein n=1 Tax=Altibacter sp. TaxID=2024823 RepID=UPI001E00B773|nr:hypothetical protein [Altibacter sp.]MBZ0327069.1 hypothetical protein [Altibacter sp.]